MKGSRTYLNQLPQGQPGFLLPSPWRVTGPTAHATLLLARAGFFSKCLPQVNEILIAFDFWGCPRILKTAVVKFARCVVEQVCRGMDGSMGGGSGVPAVGGDGKRVAMLFEAHEIALSKLAAAAS